MRVKITYENLSVEYETGEMNYEFITQLVQKTIDGLQEETQNLRFKDFELTEWEKHPSKP